MNTSLIILASLLAISAAQMTFSDGWEKRSGRAYAQPYGTQKATRSVYNAREMGEIAEAAGANGGQSVKRSAGNLTPITNCMEGYMAGVRALQAAMMILNERFQTCDTAMINPFLTGSHTKI